MVSRFLPPAPKTCHLGCGRGPCLFENRPGQLHPHSSAAITEVMMLLALARCSDLAALDARRLHRLSNGVRFVVTAFTKTRCSGLPREVFYHSSPEEPQLCPVQALDEYVTRTACLRRV